MVFSNAFRRTTKYLVEQWHKSINCSENKFNEINEKKKKNRKICDSVNLLISLKHVHEYTILN